MAAAESEKNDPGKFVSDWATLGNRPEILVSIGKTMLGAKAGALARAAGGEWVFVDYLTKAAADKFYFENSRFPNDQSTYLAGDNSFKNFAQSAQSAFTGGDGIDIVSGDIRVDSTVSRAGHIHDDRYYTEIETDALIETRVPKHRFPINDDGTYNVIPSYSNSTRRITLTPIGPTFDIWINGKKWTFTGAQSLPQHPNASGVHFYYLDENGSFQVSPYPFDLLKDAPVAIVMWNATKGEARWVKEFHTTRMSARTHENLHSSRGARPELKNGFAISGFTLNSDTSAAVSFGVSGGILWDEDIKHQVPALIDGGPYEIWYREGASGDWTWDDVNTLPYKYGATYFTVNQLVAESWSQVQINSGGAATWGNLFVVATPNNGGVSIVCVQGQSIYTDAASATVESWDALDKGNLPFPEYYPLYRVTYKASVAYTDVTGRVRIEKITSVAQGGESGISGATVHNSLGGRDALDAHPALSITDIYNLSNGVLLKKTSTGLVAATAADLPAHASRHHWDGADPLVGQSIAGLRITSEPRFAFLYLQAASTISGIGFFNSSAVKMVEQRWDTSNDRMAFFSCNDNGSTRNNRFLIPRSDSQPVHALLGFKVTGTTTLDTSLTGLLKAASGIVSAASAADLPLHATRHHYNGLDPIQGQSLSGLLTSSDPTFRNLSVNLLYPYDGIGLKPTKNYFDIYDKDVEIIATVLDTGIVINRDLSVFGNVFVLGAAVNGITKVTNGILGIATGIDLPSHNHVIADISDSTAIGRSLVKSATQKNARDVIDSPSNYELRVRTRISVKDPQYAALATLTNWAPAFNAAAAAAAAIVQSFSDPHLNVVSESVFVPSGQYPCTEPILHRSCVQWEGAGSGCTEIINNFGGETFTSILGIEYSNVRMRGIKIRSGRDLYGNPYGDDVALALRGFIRNCGFTDIVMQGFYDSVVTERSWTPEFYQCCAYNSRHRHFDFRRETGIIDIIGGRYDECEDYGIHFDSSEGELTMRNVIVQSGKRSAVKIKEAPTVYLENCFFESNCINSTDDYHIELTRPDAAPAVPDVSPEIKNDNTSAKVINCAINNRGMAARDGLGFLYVKNFKVFQYEERWGRNYTLAAPKIGVGVESIEIQLSTAESLSTIVDDVIGPGKANHVMVRQVARPTRFYGQDMKSDGDFAPEVRGTLLAGGKDTGVASGLYNGSPAIQGFGSPAELLLNPDRGHVKLGQNGAYIPEGTNQFFGRLRHTVAATSTGFTPGEDIGWAQVDCSAEPHQVDLTDESFPIEYGNTIVIGKTDATANALRITHETALINGQPYLDLTLPRQQVTLGCSDGEIFIISKFPV